MTAPVKVIQIPLDHSQEELEPVHKLLKGPQSGWRSVFLLPDAQAYRTLPSPLVNDAGSQTPTMSLLFMDTWQIFIVDKRQIRSSILCHHDADVTCHTSVAQSVLHSLLGLFVVLFFLFLLEPLQFYMRSCHLQTGTILIFPFWCGCLSFPFLS